MKARVANPCPSIDLRLIQTSHCYALILFSAHLPASPTTPPARHRTGSLATLVSVSYQRGCTDAAVQRESMSPLEMHSSTSERDQNRLVCRAVNQTRMGDEHERPQQEN